jgi:pimeloyl-ACP methyl ester carboxylesterase
LFLRGDQSLYIKEEDIPAIRQLFPNARIQPIEHAGHWLHADQPQAFSHAVTVFLTAI